MRFFLVVFLLLGLSLLRRLCSRSCLFLPDHLGGEEFQATRHSSSPLPCISLIFCFKVWQSFVLCPYILIGLESLGPSNTTVVTLNWFFGSILDIHAGALDPGVQRLCRNTFFSPLFTWVLFCPQISLSIYSLIDFLCSILHLLHLRLY